MKILSSGVVFTLEEAISTFNVYLKRQQPYFLELWTLCYLNFYLSLPINIWICNLEESYELAVRKNHTNLMDCIHMKSY